MSGNLLFADADETTLGIYQRYFGNLGYHVHVACTGLICMDLLTQVRPDLLTLDSGLLWGGSAGVLSRIRHHPGSNVPPVILTSADKPPDACEWPVVKCLRKPVHLSDLHNAMIAELALVLGHN